ncbi:MAG: hypothetical protein ACD_3C00088G0003 [uncultured bacterium (gcode 4)]|uniref:ComEC/Rec2-related protein domain-containing protein n=1 Tax=uncultured bacterium (gcode 4) TaxID=1234023 RepID=K2G1S0_9BACT|nr:MAG: hypothetical protein ACD_3C00088G0003 [uncultured bacterium (gcode 4)]
MKMINGNLQTRISQLRSFYLFSLSFVISVLISNIQGFVSLYIFLLFMLIGINLIFWTGFKYKYVLILALWLTCWFYVSNINLNNISYNKDYLFSSYRKAPVVCRISEVYKETALENSYICTLRKIWEKNIKIDANILIKVGAWSKLEVWSIIKTDSFINKIKNSQDFNYENYLLLKNVYWQMNITHMEIIWNEIWFIENSILELKEKIIGIINRIYPWDSAKLISWIFLWTRADFSSEIWENFQRSWLSHIIAVSWYNITILIVFLSIALKFIPDYLRITLTVLCIILFVSLVWNNVAALRAAMMWSLAFLAMSNWRRTNIYSVMVFAVIIFILINPLTINYDIWFHLSFLALLWLLCFSEQAKKLFSFLPEKFSIRESVSTTIAVLLFTIPIMVVNFWTVSIISPISNIIVTPAIPLIMLFWFISIVLYSFMPLLWLAVWFFTFALLEFVLKTAQFLWGLGFSVLNINLGEMRYYFMIIYYIFLLIAVLDIHFRSNAKTQSLQGGETAAS